MLLQSRLRTVAHRARWSVAPPYGRQVALTLGLGLLLAASAGWFGDFVLFTTFGVTMGSLLAAWADLARGWRIRRHRSVSPWVEPPTADHHRYLKVGAPIGGAVGLTLALVDLLVVPL
jgi:hypothetical protein